jgi:hypothetical protein
VKVLYSSLTGLASDCQHLRHTLLTDAVHTPAYAAGVSQCALVQFRELVYAPVGSDCVEMSGIKSEHEL